MVTLGLSDEVIIALITVIGGGFLALLGTIVSRLDSVGRRVHQVGKDATIAREQTQNSHRTNLRDDIDKNHKANEEAWKATHETMAVLVDLVSSLKESDVRQWKAIDDIQETRRK